MRLKNKLIFRDKKLSKINEEKYCLPINKLFKIN